MAKNINPISETKKSLLEELQQRVEDKILEPSNAALLSKLITAAENDDEALAIAALGTTYKKTGFHWGVRMEKESDTIKYFRRNDALSFGEAKEGEPVHKLIIGDNYDALQNLLIEYRGRVDVIYIDPPYGKDSLGEFAKTNYQNSISRNNLLSMLYFRLQLAKQLLSDNGVIFCSIDDKNQAYVKCLFDEVFREKSFVCNLIWKSRQNKDNRNKTGVSIDHEYILCYCKSNSSDYRTFIGTERIASNYSNPDNDPRGDWASANMVGLATKAARPNLHYDLIDPKTNINYGCPLKGWRYDQRSMSKLIDEGRILWPSTPDGRPRKKSFWSEISATLPGFSSIVGGDLYTRTATVELFDILKTPSLDFPKPSEFIKELLIQTTKQNSIVLDFFAGSGTTGHAVLDINLDGGKRTFLLCQINEKTDSAPNGLAYDVTCKRLKRIMTGECYDGSKDFKWAKENEPYGGKLEVYEIAEISSASAIAGNTPFDVIDETLYGREKFKTAREKIDWVCSNFAHTQMTEPEPKEE